MNTIEITASLASQLVTLKGEIAKVVAAAKADAAKGTKMPVGQHAAAVAKATVAANIAANIPAGLAPSVAKVDKAGVLWIGYAAPRTLEDRLSAHAASVAKRKAVIAERKAAREAKKAARADVTKLVPAKAADPVAALSALNLKAA